MLTSEEKLSIKGLTEVAVTDAGGQEVCAKVSDRIIRHQSFNDYYNRSLRDRFDRLTKFIPLDVAAEIDRFNMRGGKPAHFAQLLAKLTGHFLVLMPKVRPAENDMAGLCKIITKSAEEVGAISAALADGKFTKAERAEIRTKIDEAVSASLEMRALLDAEEGNDDE